MPAHDRPSMAQTATAKASPSANQPNRDPSQHPHLPVLSLWSKQVSPATRGTAADHEKLLLHRHPRGDQRHVSEADGLPCQAPPSASRAILCTHTPPVPPKQGTPDRARPIACVSSHHTPRNPVTATPRSSCIHARAGNIVRPLPNPCRRGHPR